jgi:ABC-type glycerol-3-phosphate transport system substrate-binding protein
VALPVPPPDYQRALEARFSAQNPGFRILYSSGTGAIAEPIRWWLVQAFNPTGPRPHDTVDLLPALKSLNFNESVLGSTLWNAFLRGGRMTALPTKLMPLCIQYWPDVFTAAQVSLPAADWTWEDFILTCSELQTAIRAGQLQKSGVGSVLPRMTGDEQFFRQYGGDAVTDDELWMASIMGYGGAVVSDGFAALTSPAAVEGVTQLVEMVGEFASSPQAPPPNGLRVPRGVTLGFVTYEPQPPPAGPGAGTRRLARFPQLPKRGVVPAHIGGRALHDNTNPLSLLPASLEVPAEILEAAARYFMWLYKPEQQKLLGKAGEAPVIADAELQGEFWAQYNIDIRASDIVFPGYTWGADTSQLGWGWLAPAVSDPKQVPGVLKQASATINATIARARASSSSGGATSAASVAAARSHAQASAARAFPAEGSAIAAGGG